MAEPEEAVYHTHTHTHTRSAAEYVDLSVRQTDSEAVTKKARCVMCFLVFV